MDALRLKKSVIAVLIYAAATLICVFHHEIWADEAQVWLLAHHLSIPELFRHLVNEGHPSLIYLIVMPFAKLNIDIRCQQLICWGACVLSVFLLWNNTKFQLPAKIVITLSCPFIYHFPVVARNYSLIPLLVICTGLLYNKKEIHPYLYAVSLFLLANTHAIMFCFSFLLGAEFIFKTKKFFPSVIISLGLIALIAQLIGTTGSNVAINFGHGGTFDDFIRVLTLFIFNSFDDYFIKASSHYFTPYSITMAALVICSWLFCLLAILKSSKKLFYLAFLSIGFQIAVYTFVYNVFIFCTRIYCAHLIILFCCLVILEFKNSNKKMINTAIIFLFALTFINAAKSYFGDIELDYTTSERTAKFIEKNIPKENSYIYFDERGYCIAVAYFLRNDRKIYDVNNGLPLNYVVWDKYKVFKENIWYDYFKFLRARGTDEDLYALVHFSPFTGVNFNSYDPKHFELLYISPNTMHHNEMFKIYKFKE